MTRYLPPQLFALFEPRPPVQAWEPEARRRKAPLGGVAEFLSKFEDPLVAPKEKVVEVKEEADPSSKATLAVDRPNTGLIPRPKEIKSRKRKRIHEAEMESIAKRIKLWDPNTNTKATQDPFRTLFVGRLAFTTTESVLKKEMEAYGHVKDVRIVKDDKGESVGYAFVEFEREKDMQIAFREADGKKIDGKKIVVDVERGRTVTGWKPRRFGGGLGGTRLGGAEENITLPGRHLDIERLRMEQRRQKEMAQRYPGGDRGGPRDVGGPPRDFGGPRGGGDFGRGPPGGYGGDRGGRDFGGPRDDRGPPRGDLGDRGGRDFGGPRGDYGGPRGDDRGGRFDDRDRGSGGRDGGYGGRDGRDDRGGYRDDRRGPPRGDYGGGRDDRGGRYEDRDRGGGEERGGGRYDDRRGGDERGAGGGGRYDDRDRGSGGGRDYRDSRGRDDRGGRPDDDRHRR